MFGILTGTYNIMSKRGTISYQWNNKKGTNVRKK